MPELTSLNRLPPRATLASRRRRACAQPRRRLGVPPRRRGPRTPRARARRARGWTTVDVPGLWTMQGFERPHYTNVVMPFPERPPDVPEENPTGIYRRAFRIPRGWRRRPHRARLRRRRGRALRAPERRAGRASRRTRARPPSSTSPTSSGTTRPNELVAVVVRWSDASFVEDQDQWWHAGLSRHVTASRRASIADVFARAGDASGRLSVDVAPARSTARRCSTPRGRGRRRAAAAGGGSRRAFARRACGRPRSRRSTRSSSS